MRNFVFTTKQYEAEAQSHAAIKVINEFRKKASIDGYVHPRNMEYTRFEGNYLKIKHGNFRSVLTNKKITVCGQEVRVYVALRMFSRGQPEYDNFQLAQKSSEERDMVTGKKSLDWSYFEKKVEEQLKSPIAISDNPGLSLEESAFISSSLNINHDLFDVTIFETKEWLDDIGEMSGFEDFANAAENIYNYILDKLFENEEGWHSVESKDRAILMYRRYDGNWILAQLVKKRSDSDYSLDFPTTIPTDFQRGYPITFLEDKDDWRLMEQDSKSNMVLSSQQVNIASNQIRYPLFLTGRAGSGKSTLLQYIFSEVVLRYIYNRGENDSQLKAPVYLSYSANLVEDAKKLCKTLFEKNNVYKEAMKKMAVTYKDDIHPKIPTMFFVFKDLLCDCIEKQKPGVIRKEFPSDKYISFPKFHSLWEKQFSKRKGADKDFGPSISWHVIRTYIKGWDSEEFLTPDDYKAIGIKNQSVTFDTFKAIYDNVWDKWYSKQDYWDDQDLARYCLQEDCVVDRFSAVFCDESQDFTRVEIDIILNSSSFAHRSYTNNSDINKLPFVFAGDEFQTLNPTGFSWESLRGYFTDRLCSLVGLVPQKGMIPDPEVLSENFRSTRNVVKLANRMQLLRASRFDEFSIPQKSHFSQEGNAVYCISPEDNYTLGKLKEKGVVLIVPANDGESVEEYISSSKLKDFVAFNDGVPEGITILNPTQAKGLEYPNVAIFGFSASMNSRLQIDSLIKWFEKPEKDFEKDIELKYMISNAYVAVTRATSNLYIIDDVERSSFWAFAFNQSEDAKLEADIIKLQTFMFNSLSEARRSAWSEEEIGWIEYEKDIDISDENLKFLRSEEHKRDLELRAESLHDYKLMLQAATNNRSAGDKVAEARCRAKAASFCGNNLEAAEFFVKAEMYDEAVDYYWFELDHNQSLEIIDSIISLSKYSHNKKINFCIATKAPSFRDIKVSLDEMVTFLKENLNEQCCLKAWEYVISLMINNLHTKGKEGIGDILLILRSLSDLAQFDISADVSKLASDAYKIGAYSEAVAVWDSMDKREKTSEYCKAKLKVVEFPNTIEFFEGTKEHEWYNLLLNDFRKAPNNIYMSDLQKSIVCKAIRLAKDNKSEFERFLPFMLRNAENIEKTSQIISEAIAMNISINKDVIQAIAEFRFSDLQSWSIPKVSYVDSDATSLFNAIDTVKKMRKDDFRSFLLKNSKEIGVAKFANKYYSGYSRKKVARLVLFELGKSFELSGRFAFACIYYEWAANQTDEADLNRYFNERWIVCKERQAEKDDSDQYRDDALEKRRQFDIVGKVLPPDPVISSDGWEKIFNSYISTSSEVRNIQDQEIVSNDISIPEKEHKREEAVSIKAQPITESFIASGQSQLTTSAKQEILYGDDYSIVFFPQKKDIVIKQVKEEYQLRIKHGVFPENSDFELRDNRLFIVDEDIRTPFSIEFLDGNIKIIVFDGELYTGISFLFEV